MVNYAAQYRKRLKKNLRCCPQNKDSLLSAFDRQLNIFLADSPDPTEEELIAAIGPVEDMAADLMARVSEEDQARYRKRLLINRIVAGVLAALFVLFACYAFFEKKYSNINITDEIGVGTFTSD